MKVNWIISIHAAREGGDLTQPCRMILLRVFQSTPPVKAATKDISGGGAGASISIHAAREGGDCPFCGATHRSDIFQSTPPVKAATPCARASCAAAVYQSTPPVKAATQCCAAKEMYKGISIHAAREGGDRGNFNVALARENFNPRRP